MFYQRNYGFFLSLLVWARRKISRAKQFPKCPQGTSTKSWYNRIFVNVQEKFGSKKKDESLFFSVDFQDHPQIHLQGKPKKVHMSRLKRFLINAI